MRIEGTRVNWDGKDVNQLNDELFGMPGTLEPYLAGWRRILGRLAEAGWQVDAAARVLGEVHEDAAADAGRRTLAALAQYGADLRSRAEQVHAALGDQAGYRMDALTGMPEKTAPPQPAALLDPAGVPGALDYGPPPSSPNRIRRRAK